MDKKNLTQGLLRGLGIFGLGALLRFLGVNASEYLAFWIPLILSLFYAALVLAVLGQGDPILLIGGIVSFVLAKIFLWISIGTDWLFGANFEITAVMVLPFGFMLMILLGFVHSVIKTTIRRLQGKCIEESDQRNLIGFTTVLSLWLVTVCL